MVTMAQLVAHQIVALVVVGSSPTSHPKTKNSPLGYFLFHLFPILSCIFTLRLDIFHRITILPFD